MQQIPYLSLFFISLIGYTLFFADLCCWSAEIVPFFVIPAQIIVLYLASLADILLVSSYALSIGGVILFVYEIFKNRMNFTRLIRRHSSPGLLAYLVLIGVFWTLSRQMRFSNWDEFSHWGLIYKLLVLTDKLPGTINSLIFPDYPPGTALYQYFVAKLLGPREGSAYFAQSILLVTPLIVLLNKFTWKRWYYILLVLGFQFLLINWLGYPFDTLYVDALLGIYFGITVTFVLTSPRIDINSLLFVLPAILVLPLVKSAGLFFSAAVGLILLCNYLVSRNNNYAQYRNKNRITGWILLLLIIGPLLVNITWTSRVSALSMKKTFSADFSFRDLANSFSNNASDRDRTTITAFIEGIDGRAIGYSGLSAKSLFVFFIFLIGCFGLYGIDQANIRDQYIFINVIIFACIVFYCFGILLAYMYSFNEYEGTRLASFSRYIGTCILGWGIIIYAYILAPLRNAPIYSQRAQRISVVLAAALALLIIARLPTNIYLHLPQSVPEERVEVIDLASKFNNNLSNDSKVYIIWQNSTGLPHYMLRYELAPRITQYDRWSLGPPYYEGDVWTYDFTPEQWYTLLIKEQYDYVLVAKSDNAFWQNYGRLFINYTWDESAHLFKVNADGLLLVQ